MKRVCLAALALAVSVSCVSRAAYAADEKAKPKAAIAKTEAKTAEAKPAAEGKAGEEKKARAVGKRVPNYYATVVTAEQKEKIYAIQDEYEPQMAKLKAELTALDAKRDAAIESLLSAEQKAQVAKLKEEAKTKKAKPDAQAKAEAEPAKAPAEAAPAKATAAKSK